MCVCVRERESYITREPSSCACVFAEKDVHAHVRCNDERERKGEETMMLVLLVTLCCCVWETSKYS